ncbi:MAG: serine/threonine-protein kinase HipA [Planctomycetota bacterium]|jgi:serine/threonine-protein kinase HipA
MLGCIPRIRRGTSADLARLWHRMAFSVCVANSDDPPRNHGFLLMASGWRLAPGYDMNPGPLVEWRDSSG